MALFVLFEEKLRIPNGKLINMLQRARRPRHATAMVSVSRFSARMSIPAAHGQAIW